MQTPDAAVATSNATELFGSFVLGGDEFALPAVCIREVVNFPDKITALPLSPPFLEGVFTLRGSVIPVVNLGRVFNPAAPASDPGNKIAILDYDDVLVGMLFHATGEILRVRPENIPGLSSRSHTFWYDDPWVSSDVLITLLFHLPPAERGLDPGEASGGTHYWTFTPDYPERLAGVMTRLRQQAQATAHPAP